MNGNIFDIMLTSDCFIERFSIRQCRSVEWFKIYEFRAINIMMNLFVCFLIS